MITLRRLTDNWVQTTGILTADNFTCKTIELPWRSNRKEVSCIPKGTYKVVKHESPTKGTCYKVLGVPNRDNILIHGNKYSNTKGCILVGKSFVDIDGDGYVDVSYSVNTLARMMKALGDEFELTIV